MAFAEIRFNGDRIIYGTNGGPVYKTAVVQTNGGREQRSAVWDYPMSSFDFVDRLILEDEMDYINNFFHAMLGMEIGFRFKDWADFETKGSGVINEGFGNGAPTGQTFKRYAAGPLTQFRKISKPIGETVLSITMDGSPVACSLDDTTGVVTFDAVTKTITGGVAEGTMTILLTIVGHGFQLDDIVNMSFTGAWGALSGSRPILDVPDADHIRVTGNASAISGFTSGSLTWFPQARNALQWEGEFDLPARFDSDSLAREMSSAHVISNGVLGMKAFNLSGLKIVELKL